ncbi:serum response factor-like isoform X3 [Phyllopteryx taeniolatus]|uniref:serum response factor-like isoform X3 n=1 Tax=Phyllopteryx taeniolatus TaxID=161469 RepID=UPI002AD4A107|nr:serum response factor-like isoform X3 [Phyllopteryx taeniolatus]
MGSRSGSEPDAGRFNATEVLESGSEDDDSAEDDHPARASAGRRGVKRERDERAPAAPHPGGGMPAAKPGKKTRGRVKIKMAFIDNKLRRYTTFSKRKTGIMKKAYELSTLTGTQVLLLVASETGHVYTFATRKLQPMITSETGKALIQTCLNSPDSPPRSDPAGDQRMSATGFEETELGYQVSEAADGCPDIAKDLNKVVFSVSNTAATSTPSTWVRSGAADGTLLKTPAGVVFPAGFALMSGGGVSQVLSTNQSRCDLLSPASSPATSLSGHVTCPRGRALTYAPATPSPGDAGLTVLNGQSHEPASVPQVFLTSLTPVAAQIPASAVQLHQVVLSQQNGEGGASLAALQVVSLDAQHAKDD